MKYIVYRIKKIINFASERGAYQSSIFNQKAFLRLTKKTLVTSLIALITLTGTGVLYLFNPFIKTAEAVWFDDNWGYRQSIPVDTHSAAENNVYITLTVDTATLTTAKLQADCDDLRFTKANGELLAYQIVSGCDSATTSIRVGFDTMPIASFYFYMYYGNPTAAIGSTNISHSACSNTCTAGTFASEEKAPSPIAYWKFDDSRGTTPQDSTANNNDGTMTNFASPPTAISSWQTQDQCISGMCLAFDATNDVVTAGSPEVLDDLGPTSMEAWIYPHSMGEGSAGVIFTKNVGTTPSAGWLFQFAGTNALSFSLDGSTDLVRTTSNNSVTLNKWSHIALTWDGVITTASSVHIFVNGLEVSYATTTNGASRVSDASSTFRIGNDSTGATTFDGKIDEPKIYNYVRSAAQILADNNASVAKGGSNLASNIQNQPAALNNGLVGYWKMDEASWTSDCSTNTATDSSGTANSGKACPNGSGLSPTSVNSKFYNSGNFDGSSEFLSVADSTSLDFSQSSGSGGVSMSAWFKLNSTGANQAIISKWECGANANTEFQLYVNSSNHIAWTTLINTSTSNDVAGSTTLTSGTWYHVVASYNDRTKDLRVYLNGTNEIATTQSTSQNMVNGTLALLIGARGCSGNDLFFGGLIDEAKIYNRALSSADASILYNFAPGPVGYWKLEEADGDSVLDSSGYGAVINAADTTGTTTIGKYGKAINFNGANNRVNVGSGAVLDDLPAMTVSAWIYPKSAGLNSLGGIITKATDATPTNGWIFSLDSSTSTKALKFAVDYNTNLRIRSANNLITFNTWQYVTVTWDGGGATSGVHMYINGNEVSYQTAQESVGSRITDATTEVNIGDNDQATTAFDGKIDEAKIYNYVRNTKQIKEDMNAGHPGPGSPVGTPIGYWKLDEGVEDSCSGGVNDACNSGSQGSLLDASQGNITPPPTSTSGWTQAGKFGKAIVFDGTTGSCSGRCDDELGAGSDTSIDNLTANSMTLSAWIYPVSMGESSQGVIMSKNSGATPSSGWLWQFAGTNALKFSVDGTTDLVRTTSDNAITLSAWNYVTLVWNGTFTDASTVHVYVNGKEVSYQTTTNGATRVSDAASSMFLGNDSSAASTFDGTMDELKVYNLSLTTDQIKLDMNRGQAQVLGALSDKSTYQPQAANQEFCIPGDSSSCVGPVGRWDFEEGSGTSAKDSSGSGNPGTWNGTLGSQWIRGKIGKAGNFNGSDNYVNVTDAANLTMGTGSFSISAWIKAPNASQFGPIVSKREAAGNFRSYGLNVAGSCSTGAPAKQVCFVVNNSGSTRAYTTTADVIDGNWHFVEATADSSGDSIKIYVDGVSRALNTDSNVGVWPTLDNTDPVRIGNNDGASYFTGQIDQVRIFNYVRSAAQVVLDYNKGVPIAWWKMDECQGTTLNDSSGNSNTATLTITTTSVGTCSTASTTWGNGVTGKRNYSVSFDGTDDVARVAETSSTDLGATTDSYTVAAWIKTTASGTNQAIIAKHNNVGLPFPYRLRLNTSNQPCFDINDDTGANRETCYATAINDGNWHHVAGVRNVVTDTLYIYVDGLLKSSISDNTTTTCKNDVDVSIGNSGTSYTEYDFNGQIDDPMIFNYPLTATQIKTLFDNGAVRFGPVTGAP